MIAVTTADLLVSGRHLCVQPPLLAGVGAPPLGPGVPHHLHLLLLLLGVVLHMFPGNLVFQWFERCFTHDIYSLRHPPETAGVRVPLIAPGHLTSVGFLRKDNQVSKSPNIYEHLPGPCVSAHAWPGRWSWRTPCCSRACRGRAAPRCGSACGSSDSPAGQNFYYIPLAAMRNMLDPRTRTR